ncbi:uncharacterized protein TrAFT101_007530 [Trichoderma asperellum]|uniref:Uncharacterized protein n=1 Tax=Trichoderma asperellum (strain ATCC 204424 / CBS 433.97 / NBRC 101777) TaxID=1042311 RepID=A0A2T3Z4F8_TRIA4|nr:hypothetical protein M441DRAFT_48826 [Trichoderma asperellum CBS 433.97]PTB39693.1 hypothetical protein M441DRAFT_48826 [Trichoderma asperellum CBS 433.97]UKZ92586.1 hypothetical protein TrAFT101_007530 [Trichoderma asperellum]
MSSGFDRLERLFSSKRKASLASLTVADSGSPPAEPQFPSPSFIRPTATRMTAREEVSLRLATSRSPSVPDIVPSRLGSLRSHSSSSAFSRSPIPSPFLRDAQPDSLVAKLHEYQFPSPPNRDLRVPTITTAFNTVTTDKSEIPSPRSQSPLRLQIAPRVDTPPSPGSADNGSCRRHSDQSIRVPSLIYNTPPTPEDSPEMVPVRNLLADSKIFDIAIDKTIFDAFEDQILQSFDHAPLNDSYSDSSPSEASSGSSTLREPDFNDFLNLSDDDIAESAPETPTPESEDVSENALVHSPTSMGTFIPPFKPTGPFDLILTPPRASRLATAAAFEAARIAKKHNFDLVYVVNIWPSVFRGRSFDTQSPISCKTPSFGRLLAAHGLHQMAEPLQLSEFMYNKVLRAQGWIEYRNTEALPNEHARGYACSFYTGKDSQRRLSEGNSPVSDIQVNRGIIFAAYRRPRIGDCKLGRSFTGAELSSLYEDAETLVEMLVDIHASNRRCHPASHHHRLCDETGPMPMQDINLLSS